MKIETHFILNNFFPKIFSRGNVEKYVTARLATDDDTTRYTCIACRITKATHAQIRRASRKKRTFAHTTRAVVSF